MLRENQYGFCEGKTCLTNLLELFEKVNRHVGVGEPVDIVYLDFQKAFDTAPAEKTPQSRDKRAGRLMD